MNDNTSNNDEDDFIDALKDEMPQVFDNIEKNMRQLEDIDALLSKIDQT